MAEFKLDLKNRKILFALDFHARDSNANIAKKVRLSKQGVDYKIKNMIKKGIITGFSPAINGTRLGYFYGRLLFRFQNITVEKKKEIFDAVLNDDRYKWVLTSEGVYDLLIATWTKTLSEYKQIAEEFVGRFGAYIREKKESIGVKITHFQARYLLNRQETEEYYFEESPKPLELDPTDKRIMQLITQDVRAPLVQLAKKAGVSPKVVSYRLKRLQDEKVILGYRPNINNDLIGYSHYKVLFYLTNVTPGQLTTFKSYLRTKPEVLYLVEEVGITDMDMEVMLPKGTSIFEFVEKIKFEFPILIREYEAFSIKMLKVNLLPF
jgi:Lrp/AsnC family transcriptional regulator, leucine-responsive regulatory protein